MILKRFFKDSVKLNLRKLRIIRRFAEKSVIKEKTKEDVLFEDIPDFKPTSMFFFIDNFLSHFKIHF